MHNSQMIPFPCVYRVHANEQMIQINMHSTAYSAYIDIYSRIGMQLLSFAVAVHYLSP